MSQDILQFLADRASNTPLTEAQFQSLRSELTTRLNALSVDVPGSTVTVLYSGHIGDNLHSGVVAATMADADPAVRTINKTEIGRLLNDSDFEIALRNALGPEDSAAADAFLDRLNKGTRDATGTRLPDSLWDAQSARFIDATVGEVRTLTSGALADSVFAQTEMRRVLANPNITNVDDIGWDRLVQLHDQALAAGASLDDARSQVVDTVTTKSYDETAKLRIATDADGKPLLLGEPGNYRTVLDSRDFFERTPGIEGHAPPNETLNEIFRHMDPPTPAQIDAGVEGLQQIRQNIRADIDLPGPEHATTRAAARAALEKLGYAGDILALLLVAKDAMAAYDAGDTARGNQIIRDGLLEFVGGALGGVAASYAAAAILASVLPLAVLASPVGAVILGGVAVLAGVGGGVVGGQVLARIPDLVAKDMEAAKTAPAPVVLRRDPLVFDLDGDGLETTGIDVAAPILFDHTGGGIRTATGWLLGDDAFLAFDRDDNGTIDDGRELFGDSTDLYAGGKALDGFAALAQEDTNADDKVDGEDANWTKLRLWRDFNQDAISQPGELFTLDEAGIVAINVAKTEHSAVLANGNQIADLGGYLRADGFAGALGTAEQLADVDLANNPFFSEFADTVAVSEDVLSLPQMHGAGQVRNLREAASLGTAESLVLAAQLAAFAGEATRSGQLAMLDGVLKAWADTSTMATTATGAFAGVDISINFAGVAVGTAAYQAWLDKLTILERFNGQTFLPVPEQGSSLAIDFHTTREALLNKAYDDLKVSVYQALVVQTRLKPYLNDLSLDFDGTRVVLDYTAMNARLRDLKDSDAANALETVFELSRIVGSTLPGWSASEQVVSWLDDPISGSNTASILANAGLLHFGSYTGGAGDDLVLGNGLPDTISGGDGADLLLGGDGDDELRGGLGSDTLVGGAGNDTLDANYYGSNVSDMAATVLDGGTGDDLLRGGAGGDRYVYRLGDGTDTIQESGPYSGDTGIDRIELGEGIATTDVAITRNGYDLVLTFANAGDKLTIRNWYSGTNNRVERVEFADAGNTVWDAAYLHAAGLVVHGTAAGEALTGLPAENDIMYGEGGNDTLDGQGGDDYLEGGDGDDELRGGLGSDTLVGGAGNDTLDANYYGSNVSDMAATVLDGGTGDDLLRGGAGGDRYVYRLGDGTDTIQESGPYSGDTGIDRIELGEGIATTDVAITRNGYDLVLTFANAGDKLTIRNWYSGTNNRVERVEFADAGNTVWDAAYLHAAGNNRAPSGDVLVEGPLVKGGLVVATVNLDDPDGIGATSLRWKRSVDGMTWNDIPGAESGTYVITEDDIGMKLRVEARYIDDGGWAEQIDGSPTRTVVDGNLILGTDAGDELIGTSAADFMYGQAGADTLNGGADDTMLGGAGNDTYIVDSALVLIEEAANEGIDVVVSSVDLSLGANLENLRLTPGSAAVVGSGNEGANLLIGNENANLLIGLGGNDSFEGGAGVDTLRGGDGNDEYHIGEGDLTDTIEEFVDEGIDVVKISSSVSGTEFVLPENVEDAVIESSLGVRVFGNALENAIYGEGGSDTLYGEGGNDTLDGQGGDDYLEGGDGDDELRGGLGSDTLVGGAGNDTLDANYYGSNVSDMAATVLDGGTGDDLLRGGAGGDRYVYRLGDGTDTIEESGPYSGDTGIDRIELGEGIATTDVAITRNGYDLVLTFANAGDKLTIRNWYSGTNNRVERVEFADAGNTVWDAAYLHAAGLVVHGTAAGEALTGLPAENDIMYGEGGNDTLDGQGGDDYLEGGDGDDLLRGGLGSDTLVGGAGNDSYEIDSATDAIVELAGEGDSDQVLAPVDWTLSPNIERLHLAWGSSAITGIGNESDNWLVGNQNDNVLIGMGGADTLLGADGLDTLVGGEGDDTYYIEDYGDEFDLILEADAEGVDTVILYSEVEYGIYLVPDFVENVVIDEAYGITLIGNSMPNALAGDDFDNLLVGRDGGDTLDGGYGDDQLVGGAGNDLMVGGMGDDSYYYDMGDGDDWIADLSGTDTLHFGEGIFAEDVVLSKEGSAVTISLASGGSVTFAEDAPGQFAIEIVEFDGATWTASEIEAWLNGLDSNQPPTGAVTVSGTATQGQTLTASDTLADLDGMGTVGYQWQSSSDGTTWNAIAGATASTFVLGEAQVGQQVRVMASYTDGHGTAESKVSAGTPAVANVNDAPTGSVTVTGTPTQGQTLTASNTLADLDGLGMIGYQWQSSADGTTWSAIGGATASTLVLGEAQVGKQVQVMASYTDGHGTPEQAGSNALVIGNAAAGVSLVGTASGDLLVGGAGNDTLNGGSGSDTLVGGAGDDTFLIAGVDSGYDRFEGDDGFDRVVGSAGNDLIRLRLFGGVNTVEQIDGNGGADSIVGSMWNDTLDFSGTELIGIVQIDGGDGNDNITGSTADDLILGGAGADRIRGAGGADTMIGGAGDDTYVVEDDGDVVVEYADGGYDVVESSIDVELSSGIEKLTLTGVASINGIGNDGDNFLSGNSGTNRLEGRGGNDTLVGLSGDTLIGGAGDDIYYDYNAIVIEDADAGIDTVRTASQHVLGANFENLVLLGDATNHISGTGNELDNVVTGNASWNSLSGLAGNDTLDGGLGDDTLMGGSGNDVYRLGRGYGSDQVIENDGTSGNHDVAEFLSGIATEQIWLRHVGNDLEASVIGTADRLLVKDWYLGSAHHVEEFRTADGQMLLDSQVENLVQAMAAFSPPAAGETTLPQAYHDALAGVIAANWQ